MAGKIHTSASFFIFGLIVLIVLPFGLVLLLFSVFFPRAARFATYKLAQFWAIIVVKITRCRINVSGRENIPKKGALCIASNHCGIFDIVLHLAYIGRPFGFIAKRELALLPLINIWILLLGGQFINRNNIRSSLVTINKGGEKMKKGGALLIFPEGTRSRGQGILPFKAGALRLATEAGAPIVPAAIDGSYEVFEKTKIIQAVDVKLVYCPPIETARLLHGERRQALASRVEGAVREALADSRGEK